MKIRGIGKLQRVVRRVQKRLATKSWILMYHRVAEVDVDPWCLCVSPQHFAEQLEVLQEYTSPLSLTQFVELHRGGQVPQNSVVVTFDDGYADNLYNAKPLLERYHIPATVFISTGYIGRGRNFWWDELESLLLRPGELPEILRLDISGKTHCLDLGDAAYYSEEQYRHDRDQPAWQATPNSRLFFYYSVWQLLRPLADSDRQQILDEIAIWAAIASLAPTAHRPLSLEELVTLAQGNLIEIGAHTVTHPSLSTHPRVIQQEEIQQSKADLERILSCPVTSFSYPFGDYGTETVELTQSARFACACSTVEDSVWRRSDRFQLPRFSVQNWNGEDFRKQLLRWLHD